MVDAQVNGTDAARRWHADGLQERRALVELRVLTSGGGLVVVADGASQGFGWHLEVFGQFLGGRRGESDTKPEEVPLVHHVISDHVDESVVVAEGMEPDAPRVGVLVDESLAAAIDEDAPWPGGEVDRAAARTRSYSSLVVAAPAPTPMRIPRPSSFGVPIRHAESGTWAEGHCSATIASL